MLTMAIPDVEILAVRRFSVPLMYSPEAPTSVIQEVMGRLRGIESRKIVFLWALLIHLFRHFGYVSLSKHIRH